MRGWPLSIGLVAAAVVFSLEAAGQGAYPEPPKATRTFSITDQTIAQAQSTRNPLSDFLGQNQGRYRLFPTATIIPPGGWTVEWPAPALAAPEKYFISWSKGGGRFWAVDCVTQKVVQILGTVQIDLSCSRWAAMADKEVEVYFFYRP